MFQTIDETIVEESEGSKEKAQGTGFQEMINLEDYDIEGDEVENVDDIIGEFDDLNSKEKKLSPLTSPSKPNANLLQQPKIIVEETSQLKMSMNTKPGDKQPKEGGEKAGSDKNKSNEASKVNNSTAGIIAEVKKPDDSESEQEDRRGKKEKEDFSLWEPYGHPDPFNPKTMVWVKNEIVRRVGRLMFEAIDKVSIARMSFTGWDGEAKKYLNYLRDKEESFLTKDVFEICKNHMEGFQQHDQEKLTLGIL